MIGDMAHELGRLAELYGVEPHAVGDVWVELIDEGVVVARVVATGDREADMRRVIEEWSAQIVVANLYLRGMEGEA